VFGIILLLQCSYIVALAICIRQPIEFNEQYGQYSYLVVLSSIYDSQRNIMQTAEKLSITLPAEMVRVIREKVGKGTYSSNSEVIREALRGWMERDQRLAMLDTAITNGIADAESGRTKSVETVRKQLHKRFDV
jgi:antitoxin ParD1/3/4